MKQKKNKKDPRGAPRIAGILLVVLVVSASTHAYAQVIGLSVPLSGKFGEVGENIRKGFLHAIADKNSQGTEVKYKIVDDQCDTKNVRENARVLSEVSVIVGPVCFDSAAALIKEMKIPVPLIALDTRNERLKRIREYDDLPMYELSPNPKDEADSIVELGLKYDDVESFAIVDDGSAHGRGLSDDVRLIAQEKGLKAKFIASFQSSQSNQKELLRKIQNLNVKTLVIAADEYDVRVIIENIKEMDMEINVIVGELSQGIENDNTMAVENIVMIQSVIQETPRRKSLEAYLSTDDKTQGFFEGYAMLEIAVEAGEDGGVNDNSNRFNEPFDTIIGKMVFNNGRANHRPFIAKVWDGNKFVKRK